MYVFDCCCFSFAYFAEPVQKKYCIWCLIFSLEQRWCNKHCQIHPHIVKIHEKYNGIIWPWDFLHYYWNSSEHHKLQSWIHDPGDHAASYVALGKLCLHGRKNLIHGGKFLIHGGKIQVMLH